MGTVPSLPGWVSRLQAYCNWLSAVQHCPMEVCTQPPNLHPNLFTPFCPTSTPSRERETETERERETETETDTYRQTETDRNRDRHTEKHTHRDRDRQTETERQRQTERQGDNSCSLRKTNIANNSNISQPATTCYGLSTD